MTFILSKLQAWLAMAAAGALAVALLTAGGFLVKEKLAHAETRNTLHSEREGWATERTNAATALATATTKARETEQTLTAQAAATEATKNEQIHALTGRAADLAVRLRHSEANAATARLVSRTTADPGAVATAGVCDAGGLRVQVGNDLIGESVRAETIRLQLNSCEADYERARVALGGALRGAR